MRPLTLLTLTPSVLSNLVDCYSCETLCRGTTDKTCSTESSKFYTSSICEAHRACCYGENIEILPTVTCEGKCVTQWMITHGDFTSPSILKIEKKILSFLSNFLIDVNFS